MSASYEVPKPILNSAFEAPTSHWFIRPDQPAVQKDGRRPSVVYPPREGTLKWSIDSQILEPSKDYNPGYELALVNLIRDRVQAWRKKDCPGSTRTTLELLQYWRREGRQQRIFFAQVEAVETVIFLREARGDFLQGLKIPLDEPSTQQREEGAKAFIRYACKLATGAGKTTVMGMLAAWSILNKIHARNDARFSDTVLVVCPNVTIKNRLGELQPERGEASLYRTRDLVPAHLMPSLAQGRVLVTNWHVFELQNPQVGGVSAKVSKVGVEKRTTETINIGDKTTTARGRRYLTSTELQNQSKAGLITLIAGTEEYDKQGNMVRVKVESVRYVESDAAWIQRILGRDVGGKKNILVFNDEAHHAYRIRQAVDSGEEDEDEEYKDSAREATIWVDGLDRVHRHRSINLCVDLSATPYYLGSAGQETNKPFPWVISDFSLMDAIESGLVKIPQLAVQDPSGAEVPYYFNLWQWIVNQLTKGEKGGQKGGTKPEAVLKYAYTPIAMLAGLWEQTLKEWAKNGSDPRPPVFIIVCKNTKIAKVVYEWLAEGKQPTDIAGSHIKGFRNTDESTYTIRVDTKVVHETDSDDGPAKSDEMRWMRLTLDTVGKRSWPADSQGRPIFPEAFEALATKLNRPMHPPGREIRCIVSVGMLTEGWDCNTVTHIVGLRPFMSQLLCEQVVGRGLRRASYVADESGKFTEEVAKVFGVPFEVVPFKANAQGPAPSQRDQRQVHAIPGKEQFRINFPRVEGYTQTVQNRIEVDWKVVPPLVLDPTSIPPEVVAKGMLHRTDGRPTLHGPGKSENLSLAAFRQQHRPQELKFELAAAIVKTFRNADGTVPSHALFPQILRMVDVYIDTKVQVRPPAELVDAFCSPYFGWIIERLREAIRPDASEGSELPIYERSRKEGATDEVNFWTTRPVVEVQHSHLNYVVADTKKWEQSAAYFIDTHPATDAFVKNSGLGFTIPYLHDGAPHEYIPDFIVRLKDEPKRHVIIETKGYDALEEVKKAAAVRWCNAVNADGRYGKWSYAVAHKPEEVIAVLKGLA